MVRDQVEAPRPADVGGTLLAALRPDGRFGPWTLEDLDPALCAATERAADDHHVLPLFWRACADAGSFRAPPVNDEGYVAVTATVARFLRVSEELRALSGVLDSLAVPWAVVKGPVLAELAYPEPALRPYYDLDVLVHPHAFGDVVAALEASGSLLVDRNWSLQCSARRAEASLVLPFGTPLDLHWHLINDRSTRDTMNWEMGPCLERRRELAVGSVLVPVLDPVDTVLHVAVHGALSGGQRLLWVKDLERLTLLPGLDWDELVARARARRITLPVGVMLRRAGRLLGAGMPRTVLRDLGVPPAAAAGLRAFERMATPTSIAKGAHTGRIGIASARADGRSSARAFAHQLSLRLSSMGRREEPAMNPLHRPDDDPGARERYLQLLELAS